MSRIPNREPGPHALAKMPNAGHGSVGGLLSILLLAQVLSAVAQNPDSTNPPPQAPPSISASTNSMPASKVGLEAARESIWENGIGEGFRSDDQSMGLTYFF